MLTPPPTANSERKAQCQASESSSARWRPRSDRRRNGDAPARFDDVARRDQRDQRDRNGDVKAAHEQHAERTHTQARAGQRALVGRLAPQQTTSRRPLASIIPATAAVTAVSAAANRTLLRQACRDLRRATATSSDGPTSPATAATGPSGPANGRRASRRSSRRPPPAACASPCSSANSVSLIHPAGARARAAASWRRFRRS